MVDMIPLHSRVALKPGADTVYQLAVAGTEGWVRDHKVDDAGFDMVKVEWDKDHWRYNGQPDGWTFAEHFKIIGPPAEPKPQELDIEVTLDPNQKDEEIAKIGDDPLEEEVEEYIDQLSEAMEAASEGEAFMTITIRKLPNPENPSETIYLPSIFQGATSKEAGMLLDIQLAECASQSYQEMVFHLLNAMRRTRPDES